MGTAALPDLLDHVTDSRATKLTIEGDPSWRKSLQYCNEYHPRYRDPRRWPTGIIVGQAGKFTKEYHERYTLRVGDLCYVAIGAIVNRQLDVLSPVAGRVLINSPVQSPALAAAVRKDWSDLTPQDHKRSLTQDALAREPFQLAPALSRLYRYYPEDSQRLSLRLLARPLYDRDKVYDFIRERLVKEKKAIQWRKLIETFAAENPRPAADMIPFVLHGMYDTTFRTASSYEKEEQEVAVRILAQVYPDYDPYQPPFVNAATAHEQAELINALATIKSAELDAAIGNLFRSLDPGMYNGANRVYADDVALACMDRLMGSDLDRRFQVYCATRIQQLEKRKRTIAEDQRLQMLRTRLTRLQKVRAGMK